MRPEGLVRYLDEQMKSYHGKLIPPGEVAGRKLIQRLGEKIRQREAETVLPEIKAEIERLEARRLDAIELGVAENLDRIRLPTPEELIGELADRLLKQPDKLWIDMIEDLAAEMAREA